MCGIVALLGRGQPGACERVLAGLRHRGPDGSGSLDLGPCSLAMARLAILDPTARADQPMSWEGRHLVYNGEVYNFRSLRAELRAEGVPFRTTGDTEVVLKALARWGVAACERFSGMFAFAFWDEREQELTIGRDRYGIKPLYWRPLLTGGIAVASEATPLASIEPVRPRLHAVREFLRFGSPISSSIYEDVVEVEPGTTTTWLADGSCRTSTFGRRSDSLDNPAAALRDESASLLLSDRPVALFLSGGFDSALVAATTDGAKPVAITLATSGNAEEVERAKATATHYGLEHQICPVSTAGARRLLGEFLDAMDQPTIDGFNSFLVSRAAVEAGFPVALSGLGGDEVMGGYGYYRWRREVDVVSTVLRYSPARVRSAMAMIGGRLVHRGPSEMAAVLTARSLPERHRAWRTLFTAAEVERLTGSDAEPSLQWVCDPAESADAQLARLDFRTYLRPTLLRDTDVFSMANSVEVRVPLLHERFVSAMRAPDRPATKAALADSLGDDYLRHLARKPKLTFSLPWRTWIASVRTDQAEILDDEDPWRGLLDPVEARRMMAEPTARVTDALRSWALLVLAVWLARAPASRRLRGRRL
ncbi:MAG: asparagine synthase (glutamine-hydrolyzing) [Actinomycetota bacterium]|nr:asparagine synthase (glutamine-hydrolyzing) [Actinomycetota bacterium]